LFAVFIYNFIKAVAVLARNNWGHGPMASAVARAITGVWGQSPQRGSRAEPLMRGQRAKPTWIWSTFGLWTFNESRKFAHFCTIWKRTEIRYLCYLCKKSWVTTKLEGGVEQNWGCAPGPGLKPPLH